jgi:CBS domain-containing protein
LNSSPASAGLFFFPHQDEDCGGATNPCFHDENNCPDGLMEIELIEIREFLAGLHPFDALPDGVLDRLPKMLSIRYLRRGTAVPPADADANYLYIVRQGAIESRDRSGELVGKFGEGDLFSSPCAGDDDKTGVTSVTSEDTLLYLLACEHFAQLRCDHVQFGKYFDTSLSERLKNAIEPVQDARQGGGLLTVSVGDMLKRPPVLVEPQTSIREAAQLMTSERVSSLLIIDGDRLVGMITDRDLRSRCLAAGVAPTQAVADIMTPDVHTISSSTLGFEALMQMTQLNVHHLPVVDSRRAIGMVSTTDLIRHESAT